MTRERLPLADLKLHDTLRLSASGVAKVLGDLEARVLQAVWTLAAPSTAKAVHGHVALSHDVQLHTVITVLNKLVEKRLLTRAKVEQLLHYSAAVTEMTFLEHISRRAVEGVLSIDPTLVAHSFVDVIAERDPTLLQALAVLIERRLKPVG